MKPSPEEPQTINAQLRHLPAYQAILAPASPAEATASIASRVVAVLMQLKDTAAILLLLSDGSLIFGIICLFGIPGLVLYGLRWRQARGRTGRKAIIIQAILSLLHESFWMYAFYGEKASTDGPAYPEALTVLYGLGALLSAVQLAVAMGEPTTEDYHASLSDEQLAG